MAEVVRCDLLHLRAFHRSGEPPADSLRPGQVVGAVTKHEIVTIPTAALLRQLIENERRHRHRSLQTALRLSHRVIHAELHGVVGHRQAPAQKIHIGYRATPQLPPTGPRSIASVSTNTDAGPTRQPTGPRPQPSNIPPACLSCAADSPHRDRQPSSLDSVIENARQHAIGSDDSGSTRLSAHGGDPPLHRIGVNIDDPGGSPHRLDVDPPS